ncbi:MAG: archaellum component FlaC [Cocleimonas sp.]|jgi:archaellum component FlaC
MNDLVVEADKNIKEPAMSNASLNTNVGTNVSTNNNDPMSVAESSIPYITSIHHWQSDGLSSYPPRDPLVGQSQFFNDFESFIHLVDKEENEFTQVFSVVAEWGRGKSRLGYELIAQVNDASPGWYCRNETGDLKPVNLFRDDADRDQYLSLYIRYSQIATEFQNSDNWFAYGLYVALQPLAKNQFDGSIQSEVAKQCFNRLEVEGFDHQELARRLEIEKKHTDQDLYDDELLATRLVNAAYEYLNKFGIKYMLVVLDELETAAEAATYGLEGDDLKRLDGRAIKLLGQAIKEEDPRRKLPWLRYVTLCSPAIGEELREVSSLARRFNLVDLEHNAFSDVSDYVATLKKDGRLAQDYLKGVVEAAYAMSGGNFGWFNVIMAAVDEKLTSLKMSGEAVKSIGQLFNAVLNSSARIRDYVLDAGAINAIKTTNNNVKDAAIELLYGQLPVDLKTVSDETKALVNTVNEYDDAVASYYRLVDWDHDSCRPALQNAKFNRINGEVWSFEGIEQKLDLTQLLANLATYAIHEGSNKLLIPNNRAEFIDLLQLLYPHGAAEDVARALWLHHFGEQEQLTQEPTHIGPSVAMLNRLNLRYRQQSQHSLIFKTPDAAIAHDEAMKAKSDKSVDKNRARLTGLMRVLDSHWQYDATDAELGADLVTIATSHTRNQQEVSGLSTCKALHLHPKGRLVLAYVSNEKELKALCSQVSQQFKGEGKYPVLAVTSSIDLGNKFKSASDPILQKAQDYLMLHRLSHNEEHVLEQVGMPLADCQGFTIERRDFTTKFLQRLDALNRGLIDSVTQWRQGLHDRGLIAMPLRASSRLSQKDLELLVDGWADLIVRTNVKQLSRYDKTPQKVDDGALYELVKQLKVPQKEINDGFSEQEWSQVFSSTDEIAAQAQFPPFICRLMKERLFKRSTITLEYAKQNWFFGYSWHVKPNDVFKEWMLILNTALLVSERSDPSKPKNTIYALNERSAFEGHLKEAENWLTTEYPTRISEIANLFGEGRINTLFAPEGKKEVGAKTHMARAKLKGAFEYQSDIKRLEETTLPKVVGNWYEYANQLASTSQARYAHQDSVQWVYQSEGYQQELTQKQYAHLDFEQDTSPLWKRIAKAKSFADQVYKIEKAVTTQTAALINQIKADEESKVPFPRNIFTLSLEKISRILAGAIRPGTLPGETPKKQHTEAGTLGFYLRNLNVEQALIRLEQLAKEVGYNQDTEQFLSLEDIDGSVITSYLDLKKEFLKQQTRSIEAVNGLAEVQSSLDNVPADFGTQYPDGLTKLEQLKKKIKHVDNMFDNIQDDADLLKDRINSELQIGQFKLLREQVPPLLSEVKKQLTQWSSDIATLKNYVVGYREVLLDKQSCNFDSALHILQKINGEAPGASLTLKDVENMGSLAQAKTELSTREAKIKTDINSYLDSSIVSAERWSIIVNDLAEGKDPSFTFEETAELVNKQLIVQTYRLGGE